MYGILAIHEVCIQLDCVGMRRVWHLAIPSYKKAPAECSAGAFCILRCLLQSFEHLLNEVVDVALIASVGFLDATVGDDHANRCGFVTHEASKSGER